MAQDYGAAQPIYDWVNKTIVQPAKSVLGAADKIPPASKAETMNWKPEPNEEQKAQIKRQSKASDDPKLGGTKKKSATKKKTKTAAKRG